MNRLSYALAALALSLAACSSGGGADGSTTITTIVGPRTGVKGRITGYLYDGETGKGAAGVTVKTLELGNPVSVTTQDGFFVLDNLTASAQYRVIASGEGYATRFQNVTIAQGPQDVYDAIPVGQFGAQPMVKLLGSVTGRVEFLTSGPNPLPIANAKVVVDLANNGSFEVVRDVTTAANGSFTIDGLPSLPTGLSTSICVFSAKDAATTAFEFIPTCTNVTVYSGQTNFIVIRPTRYDLNTGDVNVVQGVVRDNFTRLPIEGVEVIEVGRETSKVTTDANGFYFYKTTSVNKFAQILFRKSGFAEGYTEFNFGRGGNSGFNINLYPGGASVTGRLLYANLVPANQAEVRIDLRTSNGVNIFKLVKTNATGDFTITDLPAMPDGLNLGLTATPWTADPDLYPETVAQGFTVTTYPNSPTPVLRQLTSNATLSVVAFNAYSGFLASTDPAILQVTLPTIVADNSYTLTDNSGNPVPFTVSYADNNRRITVTPLVAANQPYWAEARTYTLTYRLRANNGPNGLLQSNFGFTPRSTLNGANISGRIGTVTVDSPDIDSTTRTFNLRWAPLPDAFSYSVYVRTANTTRLPGYTRLGTVTATQSPVMGVNIGNFNLASIIEPVSGQPFAFGQILTFLVIPVDSRGIETDATKGSSIDLKDVVAPRVDLGVAQLDNGNGTGTVRFVFRSTEAMDRTTGPTVTLPSGLTAGAWAVDEVTGGVEGTLTTSGTIGANGSLTFQLRDTSGNLSRSTTVPVFANALIPAYGFEDTATSCSTTGWTIEANTNCGSCMQLQLPNQAGAAPVVAGTLSAYQGVCAANFGDPDAFHCGTQSMYAPIDLSNAIFDRRAVNLVVRYWPYYGNSGSPNRLQVTFQNTVTMGNAFIVDAASSNNQRTWQTVNYDMNANNQMISGRLRLMETTQNNCQGRGGFQVDDIRMFVK